MEHNPSILFYFHCVFFLLFLEWADLYYVYMHSMMQSEQCYCSTEYNYQLVECRSLRSFFLLQILTLSSNVAHSCRASCGEFTAQWIRVTLSHRKGFGEHPTPPSHTSSPGQIRYGNPTKTRFDPIISVVLLLSGPATAPLSSSFASAISLSAAQILLHPYTAGSLLCISIEAGQSDYDHIKYARAEVFTLILSATSQDRNTLPLSAMATSHSEFFWLLSL